MIVNHRTLNVKPGRTQEAVELITAEIAADRERGYSGAVRIYTPSIGRFDQLAVEWEYEDLAEYEKGWAEWRAQPTTAEFMKKWLQLTKGGGINEIWDLAE